MVCCPAELFSFAGERKALVLAKPFRLFDVIIAQTDVAVLGRAGLIRPLETDDQGGIQLCD